MSLFHLYAAVDIVPAQVLRPVHVGFMLLLVFLLFPIAKGYRNRLMWWDIVCALLGVATIAYLLAGGDDIWDRNTLPNAVGRVLRRRVRAARAGSVPAHVGLDHAGRDLAVPRVRVRRPVAAGAVAAPRLRRRRA